MSSFEINKKEYIKVAGILAGIAAEKGEKFFLYDYKNERRFDDKGFIEALTDCFNMNSISVYEQYSPRHEDMTLYTDSNEYTGIFVEYKKKGRTLAMYPETLKKCVFEIHQFFHSAIYQTEKEEFAFKMRFLFSQIIDALIPCIMGGYECQSWGEFDLSSLDSFMEDHSNIEILF